MQKDESRALQGEKQRVAPSAQPREPDLGPERTRRKRKLQSSNGISHEGLRPQEGAELYSSEQRGGRGVRKAFEQLPRESVEISRRFAPDPLRFWCRTPG